ncbi:AAA family ATPase, partial [Thermoflexus sp.]|uniref:AAA family ATPase n=1 Tax=Thermoflexus sp. TaxID=1969742 RepID=UPI002ADD3465
MRILQMQARNFFSFENLDLKLDPGLTVIVGPNGSGKTNLARLLRMAVDVCLGNGDPWREAERRGGKCPVSDDASTVCLSLRLDQKEELVPLGLFVHEVLLGAIQESYPGRLLELLTKDLTKHQQVLLGPIQESYPGRLLELLTKDLTKQQPTKAVEAALVIRRQVGRWNAEIQLRIDDQWVEWRDRALILPLDKMARSRLLQFLCEISSILAVRDPHMNFHKTADQIHELLDRSQIEGAVLSYDRLAARDPWFVQQVRTNLLEPLGIKLETGRVVSLGEVLGRLLQHGIQIADNIRLPYWKTRWGPEAFGRPARAFDIGNGMDLPLYLLRLQHGDPEERRKFEAVRDIFRELTGHRFNIRLDAEGQIAIALEEEFGDVPIEFESAGRWEALILSAMIAEEGRVLVLDEPALNLHPTLQRRILKRLRERKGQTILITHSPYMVPVEDVEDLRRIVRFQKEEGATRVYTLGTVEEEQKLLMTLRRSTDMASLLFARGVILTEGETESGALAAWWGK